MMMAKFRGACVALLGALLLAAPLAGAPGYAQQAAPAATPSPAPDAAPAPPIAPAPSPTPATTPSPETTPAPVQAPATPTTAQTPAAPTPSNDSSTGQTLDMAARPAAYMEGKATWDEGFAAITGSFALINAELTKDGLAPAGRPVAVFVETDDTGFKYRAMMPIDKLPEGKTSLSETIKLGLTPAGKAMRFEHRGSY